MWNIDVPNIERTQFILSKVTKLPTDIYGLKWKPSLEPHIPNDLDWLGGPYPGQYVHFTPFSHQILEYAFNKLSESPKLIVEIGVDHSETSSTSATSKLLKLKPNDCTYVGIDIEDKSHLNDFKNNVYTLKNDSADTEKLYTFMDWYGYKQIDFMLVDGWHSVNQVIKEWKYWERMAPDGIMVFHDTNYHPGPVVLFDAIDTNVFSVELFARGEADWGIGVIRRLKI